MSKLVKIGILVVVAIAAVAAVLAVPSMVLAQGPGGPGGSGGPGEPGGPGRRGGMRGGGQLMAQYQDEIHTAIAKALGLSIDELDGALDSGQTIWQIAETQGVSVETLQDAMQAAHADILAQLVADGTLTQAQADAMGNRVGNPAMYGSAQGPRGGNGAQGDYSGDCHWGND